MAVCCPPAYGEIVRKGTRTFGRSRQPSRGARLVPLLWQLVVSGRPAWTGIRHRVACCVSAQRVQAGALKENVERSKRARLSVTRRARGLCFLSWTLSQDRADLRTGIIIRRFSSLQRGINLVTYIYTFNYSTDVLQPRPSQDY